MPFDAHKNFAKATVSIGYLAVATEIILSAGGGARFPDAPFNATWWNSTDYSDPADDPLRERIRVTDTSVTDTWEITRGQEGTSAQNHNLSGKVYKVVAGLGANDLIDIEDAITNSSAVPPFRRGPGPSVANGLLIRGANVHPKDATWISMVEEWDTQWPNFIKPQLDLMKSIGINSIRHISGLAGVIQGNYTFDAFWATYKQLVEYCGQIGLYVYATVGDSLFLTGTGGQATIDSLKPYAMQMVGLLNPYPQVVAIDLWNEFFYNQGFFANNSFTLGARQAIALDWYTSAKQLTNLPLTWSLPTQQFNSTSAMWNSTAIADMQVAKTFCDFIDMHIYYDVQVSDLAAFVTALAGVPFLIGEVGYNNQSSDAVRSSKYSVIGTLVSTYPLAGALAWAAVDGFSSGYIATHPELAGANFGLYQNDVTTPYPLTIASVQTWPTARAVSAPSVGGLITANITYFGSFTGNDANDGKSSSTPKTAQGAANLLKNTTVIEGVTVVLQFADSTSYGEVDFPAFQGTGICIIRGNTSNRHAVKLDGNGASHGAYIFGGRYQTEFITLHSGKAFEFSIGVEGGVYTIGNGTTFIAEAADRTRHVYVKNAAASLAIAPGATYYVEGGCDSHIMLENSASSFSTNDVTINCNGNTIVFSAAFLRVNNFASMQYYAPAGFWTVANGSITGKRWSVETLSLIQSFGGIDPNTFWPGNSNGSADASSFSKSIIT